MENNMKRNMTDKEKFELVLESFGADESTFEDLVSNYLRAFSKDFPASRLLKFITKLNNEYLLMQIIRDEHVKNVSAERAIYLRDYLSGNTWKDEESARRNLQPQINNAQAIIDACKVAKHLQESDIDAEY